MNFSITRRPTSTPVNAGAAGQQAAGQTQTQTQTSDYIIVGERFASAYPSPYLLSLSCVMIAATATASTPHQGEPSDTVPGSDPPEAECPVCYQEYNRYTKCPRMLECLHVFCTECLQRIQPCLWDTCGQPALPCPLCRHLTPLLTGDPLCLPPNLPILARLPPSAYGLPASLQAVTAAGTAPRLHVSSVTQRVVLSMETAGLVDHHHHRFIILPTVSLHVQQMHPGSGAVAGGLRAEEVGVEVVQQHKRKLVCVQVLAVAFWVMFVITCVVGVVFGPHFFHK